MTIDADFIRKAAALQGTALDERRAAELAIEVERLDRAVREAADRMLHFDMEPGNFAAVLAARAR